MDKLQKIISNISGMIRNDSIGDEPYLVVPTIMVVEGVLEGSGGPLFYPGDELSKLPQVWNTKPAIVYHPAKGDTACDPSILASRQVGILLNTSYEDGKLKSEVWLDVEKCNKVDDRILAAVENNEMMEVSTGLFAEIEMTEGIFNEKPYGGIARNIRPDHLALLPDLPGACSIEDGAGFLRLNEKTMKLEIDQKKFNKGIKSIKEGHRKFYAGVINRKINEIIDNELSHDEIREKIYAEIRTDNDVFYYIVSVYDSFFVYENETENKYYKQGYKIENNIVTLVDSPEEVVRIVEYRSLNGSFVSNNDNSRKENKMDKEKMVNALISNKATKWEDGDKDFLMQMNEENLEKMIPVEETKPEVKEDDDNADKDVADSDTNTAEDNKPKEVQNVKQYIQNAPKEIRDLLENSLKEHNASKSKLIANILGCERNLYTEKQLSVKNIDELKAIANLATTTDQKEDDTFTLNYSGQGDVVSNSSVKEDAMELPSISFEK